MTKLFPNSNFALELQAATFLESLTAARTYDMCLVRISNEL